LTQIFGVGVVHADRIPATFTSPPMATSSCPASVRQDGANMRGS
jgi:hypothetical protein